MLVSLFYWTEHTNIELRFCENTFKRVLFVFLLKMRCKIVLFFQALRNLSLRTQDAVFCAFCVVER
jgi:hypothetical protein